jgi:small-conductance mechanosensitive channel
MSLDPESWGQFWSDFWSQVAAWLPSLIGALVLLILGWLVASLGGAVVRGLLRRLGLDRLAERTGVSGALVEMGLDGSASRLLGRLIYWSILLLFVLAAAESLGLPGVSETLRSLVSYLPNVLASALILLLGGFLARIIGDATGALAIQSGIDSGAALGQAIKYTILALTVILALQQLGIQTALLVMVSVVLIAAVALALALAFGLGSRELARNIMAGFHAKEMFTPGQTLTVRDHTGQLISIGTSTSLLETKVGRVSIPNQVLVNEEVLIASQAGDGG